MTQLHSHPTIRQQKPVKREFFFAETENPKEPIKIPIAKPKAIKKIVVTDVTIVLVNFKTKHLTQVAVQTFRKHYPAVDMILVDNFSQDNSREWISRQENEHTRIMLNERNIGHGPALHRAIQKITTRYVFTLDSDTKTIKGGFLEKMLQQFANDDNLYALGWLRWVNQVGVSARGNFDKSRFTRYVHPCAAMYDLMKYRTLAPCQNHGSPFVQNMRDAQRKGYKVASFPIEQYVEHLIAGTRRMWKGHWFPADRPKMEEWNKDKAYPI